MNTLTLEAIGGGTRHAVPIARLLVAGFTGRDTNAVKAHVAELAAEGIPVPKTTPALYRLDPSLVRQTSEIVVEHANTSGEVEPVIVVTGDGWLLTVGSDHTDRELERRNIAASKAACPKLVGPRCIPLAAIDDWDGIEIASRIDDDVVYQHGNLGGLLPLDAIVNWLEEKGVTLMEGDVVFLGTVPARGGIRPSQSFSASLRVPGVRGQLTLAYNVITA